jgi:integrase
MKPTASRKGEQGTTEQPEWPKQVQPGRSIVRVYRRKTPAGNFAFMVANYADGEKRRMDCYPTEEAAIEAATELAKRLDRRDYVAAGMTKGQALDYANASETLKPFNLTLSSAASSLAEWLRKVGDLSNIHAAIKLYGERHRQIAKKNIADVASEFLKVKRNREASGRYMEDLTGRLKRFTADCNKACCNITTTDVQEWLDSLKLSPQSYRNYRTVLNTLFTFAVARSYAVDNPVEGVERVKVRNGDVQIFTPSEIARLLEATRTTLPEFLPCIAVGAFAGLRSAEIERLEFEDIDLKARHIVVGATKAKTASRRIVPIHENLFAWLQSYAEKTGKLWTGSSDMFYRTQEAVAKATATPADEQSGKKGQAPVEWKQNGLRHSYASYRFAQLGDAGRVAGELGNSAVVVHRHYRELVKPADALAWFAIKPESPANVITMPARKVVTSPLQDGQAPGRL